MVDDPAFTAGVVIRGAEPAARVILGVGAQPVPQRSVGVIRCY